MSLSHSFFYTDQSQCNADACPCLTVSFILTMLKSNVLAAESSVLMHSKSSQRRLLTSTAVLLLLQGGTAASVNLHCNAAAAAGWYMYIVVWIFVTDYDVCKQIS